MYIVEGCRSPIKCRPPKTLATCSITDALFGLSCFLFGFVFFVCPSFFAIYFTTLSGRQSQDIIEYVFCSHHLPKLLLMFLMLPSLLLLVGCWCWPVVHDEEYDGIYNIAGCIYLAFYLLLLLLLMLLYYSVNLCQPIRHRNDHSDGREGSHRVLLNDTFTGCRLLLFFSLSVVFLSVYWWKLNQQQKQQPAQ